MAQLEQQVARRLTRFYILALTVLAVLALSGLLFIRQTLNDHDDDSRVVNVAGRQRMLSQRLTKLALLQTTEIPTPDTASFTALLNTWSQIQRQLRDGTLRMEKDYLVRKSRRIDQMLAQIEPVFQSMYQNLVRINTASTTPEEKKAALQAVLQAEPLFLEQMNAIVFQFDQESFERVRALERIEWVLTIATLLTLLIEGLLIFRPVVKHTKDVIRKLTESDEALRQTNAQLNMANYDLENANRQLVITQRELLWATEEKYRLQMAEEKIRSAGLLEGQEEERRRFARELHDGIGQMLTGLKLHAEKLKAVPFAEPKHRERFEELCNLIYDVIQTTRQTSHNLMPSVLNDFGLGAALQFLAEQTTRSSGIPVTYEGETEGKRLTPAQEIGLYRIAQEALNNAMKHAEARQIIIRWQHDGNSPTLTVEDDGKGFVQKAAPEKDGLPQPTHGLENMRTRARLLNGELTIASKRKKGTKVTVCLTDTRNA
ncbi:histidine kinase/DNA gyrase B/HSP90-like ATPase [Larkinella arboricola]|uniref:histidine kinase n=1 Tax=Larkinella arboricola TaxID=643671 RepID=A0A327X1E3_LARAB|nr:ATP-binding protein [Larkinella arboricola]RAJ99929.1 histidine kinase/DNA gyrase B/HSP90-like ATPase [Larkinella arboricola]